MSTIRWNIAVSQDTDQALRLFLAGNGGGRKGDLSHFVEEAVRSHILELTAENIKQSNANLSEAELSAIVSESIEWARNH